MRKEQSCEWDVESDTVVELRRSASPCLCMFVTCTLALSFASLFLPLYISRKSVTGNTMEEQTQFQRLLQSVERENAFVEDSQATLEQLMIGDCVTLRNRLYGVQYVASGWTKAVFSASLDGRKVALKVPDFTSVDTSRCVGQNSRDPSAFRECYTRSLGKMLKELLLFTLLAHQNVVQVLHFCVDEDLHIPSNREEASSNRLELLEQAPLIVVTEYGSPIEPIQLLQLKWEDRLQVAYNIGQLLEHFANNKPRKSALISDFRASQFVLSSDGALRLTDLDDVNIQEPSCYTDADCNRGASYDAESANMSLNCVNQQCHGHNEQRNLAYAATQLDNLILQHGAPTALRQSIEQLLWQLKAGRIATARRLFAQLEEIVESWTSGTYLEQPRPRPTQYSLVHNSTAGIDYRCRYVLSDARCLLSVYDVHEAASLCDADAQCGGYVMLPLRNWSGRQLTLLRTQVQLAQVARSENSQLFVKM